MIRAVAVLLFAAALTLLAATGCSRSTEVRDPKIEFKDKPPIEPVEPGGVPGPKGVKKGPTGGNI
jgi:hypothetical protein